MIDGLVLGRLMSAVVSRTDQHGKPYVTATAIAVDNSGVHIFVNAIAFHPTARQALLMLNEGESVALSGGLKLKIWTDREGQKRSALDMEVHSVLTLHHAKFKRKAMQYLQSRPSAQPPASSEDASNTPAARSE
ncbi:single-stranded DNA-binding protein [Pandoraea apista]|uniref:single-stranded DNA-binding protein n=1 Tax=Pandoraea apista TaxID=93218 RepID=UPI000F689280|nr:single-stranded DNA-binding protein [Pandoraea apista]RRW95361.1 single-stranded DNA-binding protein [Pandoraea apista]RRX04406.1 single-stranded DNA-binding protein [Pandoraea apista]